jgi:hypothetical protein
MFQFHQKRATVYGIPNEKNNDSGNNAVVARNTDPAKVNRVIPKSKNFAVASPSLTPGIYPPLFSSHVRFVRDETSSIPKNSRNIKLANHIICNKLLTHGSGP